MFIYSSIESIKHEEIYLLKETIIFKLCNMYLADGGLTKFEKKTLKSLFSVIPPKMKTYFQDKN